MSDEQKAEGKRSPRRREFLQRVATGTVLGAMAPAFAQSPQASANGGETREQLRQDMMSGIEDDIKRDLDMRARAAEELPRPKNLRTGGMLDARFPVYYKTAVPEAMRLLTEYFAAFNERDMETVAKTLHFPYATYEGIEPLLYHSADEFLKNPPPSIHESNRPDSQMRPGTYDIIDVLQLQTFNPVNVGLELCYSRYRADGYRLGVNHGIYAITNNDGKWGIQLSSIIFTPTEDLNENTMMRLRRSCARAGQGWPRSAITITTC
jgi:hypothetical protein